MSPITISILGFLCAWASVCAVWLLVTRRPDPVAQRLLAATRPDAAAAATPALRFQYGVQSALANVMRVLRVTVETRTPGLQKFTQQVILLVLMALVGVGATAFMVTQLLDGAPLLPTVLVTVAGAGIVTWLIVRLWLRWHAQRWAEQIISGLVNVLDLWVLCLGSGMSFQAGLVRVAEEPTLTTPVLREQLELTHQAMLAGASREDALRYFARRCGDLPEIRSLVAHIIHAERIGSSLAQTLKMYAQNLRFKRSQDARELIHKLPVKLAVPLVFCILPALLVIIAGPAMLRIVRALSSQ